MDYDLDGSLMHQLHRASQAADELFASMTEDQRLTPRQFVVLAVVAANDGLSQTQIVKLTGIDRSTIADMIRRMIRSDLLVRSRTKEDARAYSVKITMRGQTVMSAATELALKVDEALLKNLSDVSKQEFRKSLSIVASPVSDQSEETPTNF